MPASTRRLLLVPVVIALIALSLSACGGGDAKSRDDAEPSSAADVTGTYEIIEDSDGQPPAEGVTVTMVLNADGTLTLLAVSPDDELADTGTYSINDGLMTIAFDDQGVSATDKPYSLKDNVLEIPLKLFSEGEGSSTWKRTDGQAAAKATEEPSELKSDWDAWDLKKDAGAAATKQFVEAVTEYGVEWEQAVTETAAFVRTFDGVQSATVSENGLNITIQYEDGTSDTVITERMLFDSGASAAADSESSQRLVSLRPVTGGEPAPENAVTDEGCSALPGNPSTARPPEPGREGLNPAGGYGVAIYDPGTQPKPITSADTPPKRALIVAPSYELDHPLRSHGKNIVFQSFKEALGPTIECVQSDLKGAGYTIDTVLGTTQGGKAVHAGDQAIVEMANFLKANKYGVFYALSHGANIDYGTPPHNQSWIYMGLLDLERPELKKAVNGRKINPAVKADIAKALAPLAGLTWSGTGDAPFVVGAEFDGSAVVWVTPAFFQMMRTQAGVSFDKTLVFLNLCSSGNGTSLSDAFKAKAFFGWQVPISAMFVTDTAETIFDSVTDKARSARDAFWMWRRHEVWKIQSETTPRDNTEKPEQLKALGAGGVAYDPITSQTVILIYRLRHGPSSASADITQSLLVVKACSEQFWSLGKGTGLASPACHQLEFGSQLPTNDEVADAIFEVGGGGTKPFGRWTLAD